uniref:hypothetical protein n=1 Tax=Neorhizobium sp. EC2-8 TaxID=3129230 RepID=UPI003100FC3D
MAEKPTQTSIVAAATTLYAPFSFTVPISPPCWALADNDQHAINAKQGAALLQSPPAGLGRSTRVTLVSAAFTETPPVGFGNGLNPASPVSSKAFCPLWAARSMVSDTVSVSESNEKLAPENPAGAVNGHSTACDGAPCG